MASNTRIIDPHLNVLKCISTFIKEHHYAPTIRELCALTSLRSKGTVTAHLRTLRELGLLVWQPGQERTLVVTDRVWFADQVLEAFLDSRGLSVDSRRPKRYRLRSVLIRPDVKEAIEDVMNSADYSPLDAFSLASAYMIGEVETVGFVRGKHRKIPQSPSKHLKAASRLLRYDRTVAINRVRSANSHFLEILVTKTVTNPRYSIRTAGAYCCGILTM